MQIGIMRDFPWNWAWWWVIVPNLAFIAMWPVGGPSMAAPMMICGLLAVFISHSTFYTLRIILALCIFSINFLGYISLSFNLSMNTMLGSVQFIHELNPFSSHEYLIAGAVMFGCLFLVITKSSKIPSLKTIDNKILGFGIVALLANVDALATSGTRGSYKLNAPQGTPIDSASLQNSINPRSVKARNVVIIVVEALGLPNNREDKEIYDQMWGASRWEARYSVTTGSNNYFGSTTNAEMRELCGVWADYTRVDFSKQRCLPASFKDAGFKTIAMHSFEGDFFERNSWYPKVGFDTMMFADQLKQRGATACGVVFPGACDRDVPRIMSDILRQPSSQRKLVYWLTVNSHLPVPADRSLGADHCRIGSPKWRDDFPMLCRLYQVQRNLADSLTKQIMADDFPDADILIVGDHMPPFFPRHLRSRFDAGRVPWILLRNRKRMGL